MVRANGSADTLLRAAYRRLGFVIPKSYHDIRPSDALVKVIEAGAINFAAKVHVFVNVSPDLSTTSDSFFLGDVTVYLVGVLRVLQSVCERNSVGIGVVVGVLPLWPDPIRHRGRVGCY